MILLVEDDPILRRASSRALRAAGYQVLPADSVMQAIAVLQTSHKLSAIVSDYDLGDGTAEDIAVAVQHIYVDTPNQRCILYSANSQANVEGWPKFMKPNIQSVIAMLKEWKV